MKVLIIWDYDTFKRVKFFETVHICSGVKKIYKEKIIPRLADCF